MSDRIVLAGMSFQARHGVDDWEKVEAQRFVVDVELVLDVQPAGLSRTAVMTVANDVRVPALRYPLPLSVIAFATPVSGVKDSPPTPTEWQLETRTPPASERTHRSARRVRARVVPRQALPPEVPP